jgi:hypothetical protein
MTRVNSKIPFVGLHAHSVAGSAFDGFGYPQETHGLRLREWDERPLL